MPDGEVWYPILADVLALHDGLMRELGEAPAPLMAEAKGKLDYAIASAIWAAQAGADLAQQAAVLAIRLAQAHAFVDNNKRVAYLIAVIFLRENGHPLPAERSLGFAQHIVGVLEHTKTITDVAIWLGEALAL